MRETGILKEYIRIIDWGIFNTNQIPVINYTKAINGNNIYRQNCSLTDTLKGYWKSTIVCKHKHQKHKYASWRSCFRLCKCYCHLPSLDKHLLIPYIKCSMCQSVPSKMFVKFIAITLIAHVTDIVGVQVYSAWGRGQRIVSRELSCDTFLMKPHYSIRETVPLLSQWTYS